MNDLRPRSKRFRGLFEVRAVVSPPLGVRIFGTTSLGTKGLIDLYYMIALDETMPDWVRQVMAHAPLEEKFLVLDEVQERVPKYWRLVEQLARQQQYIDVHDIRDFDREFIVGASIKVPYHTITYRDSYAQRALLSRVTNRSIMARCENALYLGPEFRVPLFEFAVLNAVS